MVKTLGFGIRYSQTQIQSPALSLHLCDLKQVTKPLQTTFSPENEEPVESYLTQSLVISTKPIYNPSNYFCIVLNSVQRLASPHATPASLTLVQSPLLSCEQLPAPSLPTRSACQGDSFVRPLTSFQTLTSQTA